MANGGSQELLLDNPLMGHHLCTSCGWVGQLGGPEKGPSTFGGTVAAVGGTVAAVGGGAGMSIGVILILIGLPLLLVGCIGAIPIILGIILLLAGGTATTAGTSIGIAGANSRSSAKREQKEIEKAANQCPACKNTGVVPAVSPVAMKMIQENPMITSLAKAEAEQVLQAQAKRLEVRSGYRICPECDMQVPEKVYMCPYCRSKIGTL
jgi:RNA polymerase subunit RPABC4/transcription elongation factor Spt4